MHFPNDQFFGFAAYARSKSGEWRLHFNWRRILLVLLALAVAAYLALAGMLFCWFRYKHEWEGTSYLQMLKYPFSVQTRVALRKGVGDRMIASAREQFQVDRDFTVYLRAIRAGLTYSPYNPEARIDFSSLLFYQKRTAEAFEFLQECLPYAITHKTYTQFFVRQCLDLTYDDLLSNTANAIIPLVPVAEKVFPKSAQNVNANRMLLVIGASQANLLRGRFERATAMVKRFGLENSLSGRVMQAQIDWESGRRELALANLREVFTKAPAAEQVGLLYAIYLKENGDLSSARDVLVRLALSQSSPAIRVRIITLFEGEENRRYRNYLENEYLERYKDNSGALIFLAQYATDSGRFELMKRIYEHAHSAVLIDLPKFEMLYIESLIMSGRSAEAISMLEELDSGNFVWVNNYSGVLDCLRTLAYYSTNQANLGKINLDRVLKNRSVPATRMVVLARRLSAIGCEQEAREVYETAFLQDNTNQPVLIALVKYAVTKEDVPALVRYLPPLLDTRRPPRAILERVQRFLGSDRMLFVARREGLVNRVHDILGSKTQSTNEETDINADGVLESWF